MNLEHELWRESHRPTPEQYEGMRRRLEKEKNKPLITVIVAGAGVAEPLLRDTIDSVIAQAYDVWELCVLCDDRSSARVEQMLGALADRKAYRVFKQTAVPDGNVTAFNLAIHEARGEFIAILEAAGVVATIRKRKGADIDAACGQLRLKQEQLVAGT